MQSFSYTFIYLLIQKALDQFPDGRHKIRNEISYLFLFHSKYVLYLYPFPHLFFPEGLPCTGKSTFFHSEPVHLTTIFPDLQEDFRQEISSILLTETS